MADTVTQITNEELKKMLDESILSDELKTGYAKVMDQMTDEEKSELIGIIQESNKAMAQGEEERISKLQELNSALDKHLQNSVREEKRYIRQEVEVFEASEEKKEIEDVEQELNAL